MAFREDKNRVLGKKRFVRTHEGGLPGEDIRMHNTPDPIPMAAWTAPPPLPARHREAPRATLRPVESPSVAAARIKIGAVNAVFRHFPTQRAIALTPNDSLVYVIVPTRGSVVAVTAGDTHEAREGGALLLGRAERVSCVWQAGSAGLFLSFPRSAIQAQASGLFDEPRRLASIVSTFEWSERPDWVAAPPFDSRPPSDLSEPARQRCVRALYVSLVRALEMAGLARAAFPVAKSVLRALEHVRLHQQYLWTVEDLAPIAGVTAATLRKNFRSCLGLTITQVVRDARLEWVRERLGSCNESRSIGELAGAAGFGGTGMLSRAYQQKFAETPTQTRSGAFKEVRE